MRIDPPFVGASLLMELVRAFAPANEKPRSRERCKMPRNFLHNVEKNDPSTETRLGKLSRKPEDLGRTLVVLLD